MIADRRSPHAFAVLRLTEKRVGLLPVERIAEDLPVDEVFGVQDGKSGNAVEAACRQIIVFADSDGVRITIVGKEYWILVHAVAQVRIPDLGMVLC